MVILSLAVSTSSNLGLLIAMSRNRPGLRLALGVFLCIEYNRNRRFNFVGKGAPRGGIRHIKADFYSDSSAGTTHSRSQSLGFLNVIPALFEPLNITRQLLGTGQEGALGKNTMPS